MTDLQSAQTFLTSLRASLDAREKKPSPNAAPATTASPPGLTPVLAERMPLEPPTTRFPAFSSATKADIAPRAIAALWARFTHLYGHRWETSYGPALNEAGELMPIAATWAKALAGFVPEDFARGLHACLERPDGWPPTLPEFRALCQPPRPLAPCHLPFSRALLESDERKAARKAAARAGLAAVKQALGRAAP